ncbi:MAG: InlB B-repeat-containing protein [Clostridia bacterium]|nr:InlB B-repeat-containing protein [Clostridia bacterium]
MRKSKILSFFAIVFTVVTLVSMMWPLAVYADGESYTVIFDANGGVCDTESMDTGADGTLESLPAATREGYEFAGWYTDIEGGEYVFENHIYDIDTTLFAHWDYVTVPFVESPTEAQIITAKVGETVSFSISQKYADDIRWFVNRNDGGDPSELEEDFYTTVTIENIPESYEGYVFFCELTNEMGTTLSPSFTIDLEGVEIEYKTETPEPEDGLNVGAIIAIIVVAAIIITAVVTVIVIKKKKK